MKIELIGPEGWVRSDTDTNLDLVPPLFVNRHKINDTHDHSAFVFIGRSDSRDIDPQTEEDKLKAAECRWLNQSELDELMETDKRLRPEIHRYATMALKLAGRGK